MQNTQSPHTNAALSKLHKLRWAIDKLDAAIRENDPTTTAEIVVIADNVFGLILATTEIVRGKADA